MSASFASPRAISRWGWCLIAAGAFACRFEAEGTRQSSAAGGETSGVAANGGVSNGGAANNGGVTFGGVPNGGVGGVTNGGVTNEAGSPSNGGALAGGSSAGGGAAPAGCSSASDCPSDLPRCDAARGICVRCETDAQCPAMHACMDWRCVPFTSCINTLDCPDRLVCDRTAARCVECLLDADCGDARKLCSNYVCYTSAAGGANSGGGQAGASQIENAGGGRVGQGGVTNGGTNGGSSSGTSGTGAFAGASAAGAGGSTTADAGGSDSGGAGGGVGGVTASGGSGGGAGADNSCASGAEPCSSIPQFTAAQTVDGRGDEFCRVPSFELDFDNAARFIEYNDIRGRSHYPERAVARVAWSSSHVHAFIRVFDPFVVKASNIDYIWGADSVELMISADRDVTGSTGDDPSTMRLIAAPWVSSNFGMAASVRTIGTSGVHVKLPDGQFLVAAEVDGYSVELKVPWPNGFTVNAASRVYFDLALNSAVADITGGATVRDAQAIYYQGNVIGPSPCGSDVQAYCDDRAWCPTNLD